MASLTHVCMWSNDGWKHISAEEAAKLHPGGTVSAHSGLFMCELCGQYVLLTDAGYNVRHFRHSSHEKSKNCPERTSGSPVYFSYNPLEHELPIRIVDITAQNFRFELGLLRVPKDMLSKKMQIEILPLSDNDMRYIYNNERLNINSITYVPIGEIPCKEYRLNIKNGSDKIYEYWPRQIIGINPSGTLFDACSGKKLPNDSDVELGKEYYYLTNWKLYSNFKKMDITIKKISEKRIFTYSSLYLYSITANSMNEDAAKFFLEHYYRLTDRAISIQPIWPPYVEESYVIKHNQDSVLLHIKGNASLKAFPNTGVKQLSYINSSKLYEVNCQSRQQLVSAGRMTALQYTYFWRESNLAINNNSVDFSVRDIEGKELMPGETTEIPQKGVLIIRCNCDGEVQIKCGNFIREKMKMHSDRAIEIEHLSRGKSVLVYVGLDCIWQISYIEDNKIDKTNDINSFFSDVISSKGPIIQTPHSLKNIAKEYRAYPQFYKWMIECIKQGEIYENAFRKIEKIYLKRKQY